MLQVIKAEDVRDGEPRWWCPDDAYAARTLEWIVTGNLHTEWRRDADAFTLAIVDRPAPTPTPAPGLDLDAVERAERAMTPGPWRHGSVERHHVFCSEGDRSLLCPEAGRVLLRMNEHFPHDSNAAGIVALRNAAPALIAEVRRLRALVDEREGDMHARIRAGYDKTVADAWRAEVAKRDAEVVAQDCVLEPSAVTASITMLLRTVAGEWGVRCVDSSTGKVDEDWFTAERDGRGHFADMRGKALCICGAECDADEIDRSGDEPQCPKCVAEAVAAFKAQPMRCAEDHPCGWEGTGAGAGVVEGDSTPCCPDCGGDVEEVRDV